MIYENFQIDIAQQIQINLITIVPDGHDECAILIKKVNFF